MTDHQTQNTSNQDASAQKQTFFDLLGGEAAGETNIRALVDAFYDVMDTDAKVASIRAMHPADLSGSRDKLFMFLPVGQVARNFILSATAIHFYVNAICRLPLTLQRVTNGCIA